jgi:hypothetical protein
MALVGHASASYPVYTSGETVKVFEFVYDNDYQPLTGTNCTLKVWYPNATVMLDNVTMLHNVSTGYYWYNVSFTTSLGLYPIQLKANDSGDIAYLDKSFYVNYTCSSSATVVLSVNGRPVFPYMIVGGCFAGLPISAVLMRYRKKKDANDKGLG